jgi:deoxycytidine triphosphate deaminase
MIVTDGDLQQLIEQKDTPLLTGFDPPKDWNGKDSLVQPCSIDLHIGAVYQPGIEPGKAGSAEKPKSQLVLRTGQTAIVTTQESIHLPSDYAAFGFPPSHISSRALLMTNPGHVDPGYKGTLQFTVINMGREDYVLRSKDLIVTLLIFKLVNKVNADYAVRNPTPAAATITQANIDLLSPDFVDVKKRATRIARKTLGYATAGATVLAIILGWAFNAIDKRLEGIDEMKTRLTRLEDANTTLTKELQTTKEQLEKRIDIEHRLETVETQNNPKGVAK